MASTRPAVVDDDLGFVQIEVDRAAAAAGVVQDLKELPHQLEHRDQRLVAVRQLRIAVRQDAVHRRIRHSLVAVDHPIVKLVPDDGTAPVDFHEARLHEPIDARIQAAEAGRELGGKHVDGALGKYTEVPRSYASRSSALPSCT